MGKKSVKRIAKGATSSGTKFRGVSNYEEDDQDASFMSLSKNKAEENENEVDDEVFNLDIDSSDDDDDDKGNEVCSLKPLSYSIVIASIWSNHNAILQKYSLLIVLEE